MADDNPKTSMAEKYFAAGQSALDDEDWKEARRWLRLAAEAAPDNVAYQKAYDEAKAETKAVMDKQKRAIADRREEDETVPARPLPRRRLISLPMAGLATLGLAAAVALLLTDPKAERLVDHSQTYKAVAPFTRLVVAPDGGWVGTIHEDWTELDEVEKRDRCEEIAAGLPDSGSGVMVVRTADGTSLVCLHESQFPPGPEDIPGVEPYATAKRLADEAAAPKEGTAGAPEAPGSSGSSGSARPAATAAPAQATPN